MAQIASKKLIDLIEVRDAILKLAFEQLVEDFVLHLEQEYEHVLRRGSMAKDSTFIQWLDSLEDYTEIFKERINFYESLDTTREIVERVASFESLALALEEALATKYRSTDGGKLLVCAPEHVEGENPTFLTFTYDAYAWVF